VSETRKPREQRLRRRSNRERPLLIVNTGHGKGKSTASFGVMLRGWARGYRIGVYQFVKSGKWNVGEQKAAEALGNIDWFKQGDGWTWTVKDLEHSADLAREGWEEVVGGGQAPSRRRDLRYAAPRRVHLPHEVRLGGYRRGR
jgi:cob(I)alamin adenosyltransferase